MDAAQSDKFVFSEHWLNMSVKYLLMCLKCPFQPESWDVCLIIISNNTLMLNTSCDPSSRSSLGSTILGFFLMICCAFKDNENMLLSNNRRTVSIRILVKEIKKSSITVVSSQSEAEHAAWYGMAKFS